MLYAERMTVARGALPLYSPTETPGHLKSLRLEQYISMQLGSRIQSVVGLGRCRFPPTEFLYSALPFYNPVSSSTSVRAPPTSHGIVILWFARESSQFSWFIPWQTGRQRISLAGLAFGLQEDRTVVGA